MITILKASHGDEESSSVAIERTKFLSRFRDEPRFSSLLRLRLGTLRQALIATPLFKSTRAANSSTANELAASREWRLRCTNGHFRRFHPDVQKMRFHLQIAPLTQLLRVWHQVRAKSIPLHRKAFHHSLVCPDSRASYIVTKRLNLVGG